MLNLDDVEPEQKQKLENICNFLMNEVKFANKDGEMTKNARDFLYSRCFNLGWSVFTYHYNTLWVPYKESIENLKIDRNTPKEILYEKTDQCTIDGLTWRFSDPRDITEEQLYVFCTFWDIPFDLLETSPQVIIEDEDDFVV